MRCRNPACAGQPWRGSDARDRTVPQANKIGGLAMDVYEHESSFFFHDCSDQVFGDDILSRLLSFHNVIITAHQAFLTKEALEQISLTTLQNIEDFKAGKESRNEVKAISKV